MTWMTNNLIFVNLTMKKTPYFVANIEDYFTSKKTFHTIRVKHDLYALRFVVCSYAQTNFHLFHSYMVRIAIESWVFPCLGVLEIVAYILNKKVPLVSSLEALWTKCTESSIATKCHCNFPFEKFQCLGLRFLYRNYKVIVKLFIF